jgi:hypothetical protein
MSKTIREKITSRFDQLEADLKSGKHLLENSDEDEMLEVYKLTENVSKFWRILSDEEKDLIQCARIAILEQKSWG